MLESMQETSALQFVFGKHRYKGVQEKKGPHPRTTKSAQNSSNHISNIPGPEGRKNNDKTASGILIAVTEGEFVQSREPSHQVGRRRRRCPDTEERSGMKTTREGDPGVTRL